jgi:hypothetical protein
LDFSAELQARSGLALKEILAEFSNFAPAVLGGVSGDGAYGEASMAGVFRNLFGTSVDTRRYCSLKAVPGEDAEASVNLQVEPSRTVEYSTGPGDFLALLRSARSLAERSLEAWQPGLSSKIVQGQGEAYFHQPVKAIEDTQALLQALADLSAGVDEQTTFLYMTRRITWRYLTATYPIVQEPEPIAFLGQRLGLSRIWEPTPNPKGGYTLWGYSDYRPWSRDDFRKGISTVSYGGSVLALNLLAWLSFSGQTGSVSTWWDIASALFGQPPNLSQLFRDRARAQLMGFQRPECPFPNEYLGEGVKIRGPLAVTYHYTRSRNYNEDAQVSIHTFLDWLIPSVCYGERWLGLERSYDGGYEFRITSVI